MTSLIKHYFLTIDTASYWIITTLITLAYVASIPPIFLFTVTVISLPIILHYYQDKNKLNQFMISLPISSKGIIQSRYLFFLAMTVVVLLFQLLLMLMNSILLSNSHYIYDHKDILVLLSMAFIIFAVINPIYQLLRSFILATVITGLMYFIATFFTLNELIKVLAMDEIIIFNDLDPGYTLIVEKYLPFQPYATIIIVSILLFYISMKLSEWLFIKQDRIS